MRKLLRQTLIVIFLWNLFGFTQSLCAAIKLQKKQTAPLVSLEELSSDKFETTSEKKETEKLLPAAGSSTSVACLPSSFLRKKSSPLLLLSYREEAFSFIKKRFLFLSSGTSPPKS